MKISEIFLFESFYSELTDAIRDRLAQYSGKDISDIPTEEFRQALGNDGFLLSLDELKVTLSGMDAVSNVTDDSITPKGKIDNDTVDDEDQEVSVSDMAGDAAIDAVKTSLPQ